MVSASLVSMLTYANQEQSWQYGAEGGDVLPLVVLVLLVARQLTAKLASSVSHIEASSARVSFNPYATDYLAMKNSLLFGMKQGAGQC